MPVGEISNGMPEDKSQIVDSSNKSSFLKLTSFILNGPDYKSNSMSVEDGYGTREISTVASERTESLNPFPSKVDVLLNGKDYGESSLEWPDSDNSKFFPSDSESSKYLRLKRSHWKDVAKVRCCDSCLKDFRFGSKKHNCRRCGNVFCDTCCQYRKRLLPDGTPDSQGNLYRVCLTCADLHIQQTGITRTLTSLFCDHRKHKRIVLEDELNRLINGFEANVDPSSPLKSAFESLPSFRVPDWHKSSQWLESSDVEWCSKCSSNFNFLSRKHHCRLCGYIFCSKCCKMSLLLYFDENDKGLAKLIGVVGCPDKEPSVALYLNICIICEEDLEEYQVHQYHLENANMIDNSEDKMKKLEATLEKLSKIEKKIKESLPCFQEQLDTYVFEDNPNKNIDGQNNMEIFAKAHADISDLFTRYATIIQGLKQVDNDMSSKIEMKLMQNIISVKCNQFNTEMNAFKSLKYTMGKTFPPKSLEQFQNFANTQAINNTYIMTRQIGLEALNLSIRYKFDTILAEKLSEADQICFTELKNYLHSIGEDQNEHIDVLNDLLKVQIKEKTLVLLDKREVESHGSAYVTSFLIQRCSTILFQILKALRSKSTETQFPKSKQHLQELLDFVSEQKQGKNRL